jgi:hypothetical protein
VAPLDQHEAAARVRSAGTFPLLDGYRGAAAAADVSALPEILIRVAALAAAPTAGRTRLRTRYRSPSTARWS